ncbi:FUSC family protein [Leucobacter chromiireducens]
MHTVRRALRAAGAAIRSLFALPPNPGPRHWIALRAAASMGVPLATLTALGRPDLGLQAGTGAFLALFYAGLGAAERARVLPVVGAVLLSCAALGTWLAPSHLLTAVGLVVVSIAVSAFAFGCRVGPPGPVFFVLMFGLAGTITGVHDGVRVTEPAVFLSALAAGLLFSYLLALLPLLRRTERAKPARPFRELLPRLWLGAGEQQLVVRIALVAALGALISVLWLDPQRAYWTVSTGIAVVGLSAVRSHSLGRGVHRTAGTLLGAALFLVIAPLGEHTWIFVALLTALQFLIELVVVRNYAFALVFITPLVLLITSAAAGGADPFATAGERVLDTAVGSALAILSAVVHRPPRQAQPN